MFYLRCKYCTRQSLYSQGTRTPGPSELIRASSYPAFVPRMETPCTSNLSPARMSLLTATAASPPHPASIPLVTTRLRPQRHNLISECANCRACHDEISALQHARGLGIRVPVAHRLVVLNAEEERLHHDGACSWTDVRAVKQQVNCRQVLSDRHGSKACTRQHHTPHLCLLRGYLKW